MKNLDCDMSKNELSAKFGIRARTVSTIIKSRYVVMKSYESIQPNRKCLKTCSYDMVDETVLKWIKRVRDTKLADIWSSLKKKDIRSC